MDIKFLTQENEIQKLYSKFGLVVPVGDLETGKAPAIQPLPAQATQTSVTFSFNVMSGADITAIEYKVNDGEAVSVTPQKGVVTVELSDLEYNSGPYEIELTVTNETGDTSVTQTADLVPYTDWATADEVLEGNKFIGEDGQEAVGTYVPEGGLENQAILEYSQDLFPFYYDYYAQQEVPFQWKCTVVCDIPQDSALQLMSFNVYFNYVEGDSEATEQGGSIYFESSATIVSDKLVLTGFCVDSLELTDWCNKYSPDNNMVAELAFDPIDTEAPDAQNVVVIVPCTFSAELYDTPECTEP